METLIYEEKDSQNPKVSVEQIKSSNAGIVNSRLVQTLEAAVQ